MTTCRRKALLLTLTVMLSAHGAGAATLPDGRVVSPVGFTVPVEGFASSAALSPDGKWIAVLSQDGGAVDVVGTGRSTLADRLAVPAATGLAWSSSGLYVTGGYRGTVARFRYDPRTSRERPAFTADRDVTIGAGGLLNGIALDPENHRFAVARTADREVAVVNDTDGSITSRLPATGQPYAVAFVAGGILVSLYDSDHVDLFRDGSLAPIRIATGAHPTQMLVDGGLVYVSNADDDSVVAIDTARAAVIKRFDLRVAPHAPPGQTPAGMALSHDGSTLYVAESALNDVAVIDIRTARVRARIPTAWYPTSVITVERPTVAGKDPRPRTQLWIVNAKGFGSQPDPAGEWDGTYTGLVQHLVVTPEHLAGWTRTAARNDRLFRAPLATTALPPVKHIVFIVRENKHFDEEFGDEPRANADPSLLLFGRRYTPNAHAIAERYVLFDNFMTDGEASIFGHAWTTQGMTNDYHERNAHARDESSTIATAVATSIWPYALRSDAHLTPAEMDFDWFRDLAELPGPARINVAPVFGPRGELIDELQRKHVSFRVYGEQMTMQPDGRIAPGLASHAARDYPGDHIDFAVRDTDRAKLFLNDVTRNGLPAYAYLTLPTDHTAGTRAGFYTPASYVANNDIALGAIVAGLSRRSDWKNTVVFVTCDDAQGTGDHMDSHRMPAFAAGPLVRRGFINHARYSQTSILRTVEVLFGLDPLGVYDAAANPILDIFTTTAQATPYTALASAIPMQMNPGPPTAVSLRIDGQDSARIADEDWQSIKGNIAYAERRHAMP